MKIFFDTEFIELHKNITLICVGLKSEDNRQFYAEIIDYDERQYDDWISENMINSFYIHNGENKENECAVNYHFAEKYEIVKALDNWLSQFTHVEFILDDFFNSSFYTARNVCACYHNCSTREAFDMGGVILYQNWKDIKVIKRKPNTKIVKELYQVLDNVSYK